MHRKKNLGGCKQDLGHRIDRSWQVTERAGEGGKREGSTKDEGTDVLSSGHVTVPPPTVGAQEQGWPRRNDAEQVSGHNESA